MRAIDTETFLSTVGEPVPQLVSVAIFPGRVHTLHDHDTELALQEALAGEIALANAPFDAYVLGRAFPRLWEDIVAAFRDGRVWDVLTAQKLIEISRGEYRRVGRYNLGDVAQRVAGIEVDKSDRWRKAYGLLAPLPFDQWPEDAQNYAALDAVATYTVALQQQSSHGWIRRALDVNTRAHFVLHGQTLRGLHTDQANVDKLDQDLSDKIEACEQVCLEAGLLAYKHKKKRPSSLVRKTKLARAMLETLPGVVLSYTDSGQISLSEDALTQAGIPEDHPLHAFRMLGSYKTLKTGWVTPLRSPVVRTRYEECVDTGRTSSGPPSAPWVGRNLQNTPQQGGFRECLRAPPGHLLIVSDYGALELVTLAQKMIDWFGSSALGDALRDGRDPHSEVGAELLGISLQEFDKHNPAHAQKRKLGKALNFGLPGGLGVRRFVEYAARKPYFLDITEDDAREYKNVWREKWWDMPQYFRRIESCGNAEGRYTITEERSGHTKGDCSYTEACNFPFQCLGAYTAKRALWLAQEAGLKTVLFVHDEIVSIAKEGDETSVLAMQERVMLEAARELCPDVPIKVESGSMTHYGKP